MMFAHSFRSKPTLLVLTAADLKKSDGKMKPIFPENGFCLMWN